MMAMLLDSAALIAIDKTDRRMGAILRVIQQAGLPVRTSAAVVAQVWRDGTRQANLARVLAGVEVEPLGLQGAKRAGELQAATRTSDVVDAHVALIARADDQILTSDRADIERMLGARGIDCRIIDV